MSELATALGYSVSLVSMWASGHRRIPIKICHDIYYLTGVPLRLLRPDVFRLVTRTRNSDIALKNFLSAAARRHRT